MCLSEAIVWGSQFRNWVYDCGSGVTGETDNKDVSADPGDPWNTGQTD